MSVKTIQCRLVATEETRRIVWELMANDYTPLIEQLMEKVGSDPSFIGWRQKGKLPDGIVKELCGSLRSEPRFQNQPGRFYMSAIAQVNEIYESWLALQQKLQFKLEGQIRQLGDLKSDSELVAECGCTIEKIRSKATEILTQITLQVDLSKSLQAEDSSKNRHQLLQTKQKPYRALREAYKNTEDKLCRCAITYLLKNGCQVSNKEENPKKFTKRRLQVEIQIERLTEQINSRMPKGRDLTRIKWLETLEIAISTVPQSEEEVRSWEDRLLTQPKSLPYPVIYGAAEDLSWSQQMNDVSQTNKAKPHSLKVKSRICVKFNGLGKHTFKIYCDRRQLPWFKRFVEDWTIKKAGDKKGSTVKYSAGLMSLRSARLLWKQGDGQGEPWNVHHLYLHCTVETDLWTDEGTELIRAQKIALVDKTISKMQQQDDLNKNQQSCLQRKQTERAALNNPFPRPSKPLYEGKSNIFVGVSMSQEEPVTVAVVDVSSGEVLAYQSVETLLGKNYRLFNRQRSQRQFLSRQRRKSQVSGTPNRFGESELGKYLDRLLAKAIVEIAISHQASSIVLPKLGDVREKVQSRTQAAAEQKILGYKQGQKEYAKQSRLSAHYWSHSRLIESIQSKAAQAGIVIKEGQQPSLGSPKHKARDLAFSANPSSNS